MIHNIALDAEHGGLSSNAFLVEGDRPVLVDAGSGFDAPAIIESHIDDIDAVVLTHTHPDHVGNLAAVKDHFGVEAWGFNDSFEEVDQAFADGDSLTMGDATYEVLHTPGHKNDHVCLYSESHGILFAGDLIFANGGFGRTDLAEGDLDRLIESIERVLAETNGLEEVLTGHGPRLSSDPKQEMRMALQAAERRASEGRSLEDFK